MSIIKYQQGAKFNPPPGWKPREEKPLLQLKPDSKSVTEKQTNRKLQEGAHAQKQIVDQQLTFNNIVNGQLNLNPNAMLYSRPTQTQRNQEVQAQNKSSRLENFARTTQPVINNVMQAEVVGQGMQKLQPYVQKGIIKGGERLQKTQDKLDNYIPGSIDKLIKPKYDINFQGSNKMGIGNEQTVGGQFIRNKTHLDNGAESLVFRKENDVFKIRRPEMKINEINPYKKELRLLQKHGMPETKIQGYYKQPDGNLQPVLKQKFIKGTDPTYQEIQTYYKNKGFESYQDIYRNKKHVIFDIHPGNFKKDLYGKIHPIDVHILPKKEFARMQSQVPSLQLRSWKQGGIIKYKNEKIN